MDAVAVEVVAAVVVATDEEVVVATDDEVVVAELVDELWPVELEGVDGAVLAGGADVVVGGGCE